jgi:hypothetical protein
MGVGQADLAPVLDLHPTDGPAGCILVNLRHTSTNGRVDDKGSRKPDRYRYWLDTERDYIVMRWDMLMRDARGPETIVESDTTEETARSSQGVWYATKIRRRFSGREAKDKSPDLVYDLYVDFNAEMADALFEPQAAGRVRRPGHLRFGRRESVLVHSRSPSRFLSSETGTLGRGRSVPSAPAGGRS